MKRVAEEEDSNRKKREIESMPNPKRNTNTVKALIAATAHGTMWCDEGRERERELNESLSLFINL